MPKETQSEVAMSPEQALQIIKNTCEVAAEAPASEVSLDEKVQIACARNIVEGIFIVGLDALRKRQAELGGPKTPTPLKKLEDESQPGETAAQTIARRAAEEAQKAEA